MKEKWCIVAIFLTKEESRSSGPEEKWELFLQSSWTALQFTSEVPFKILAHEMDAKMGKGLGDVTKYPL